VEELLVSISSDELSEWAAYYRLDPFGGYRGDVQAASVAMMIAQANAKKGHTFKLSDFLVKFGEPEPAKSMTPQEIHNALVARFGMNPRG
jgi:hypothetical protein